MNSTDYKYPITECDVPPERRPKLESYRAKRRQWLTWLDIDEHHAIWTNLSAMAWTDVSFGIFRELAESHEKAGEKTCLHNPLIAEQIVYGHVARQVLGDPAADGPDERRYLLAPTYHRSAQRLAALHARELCLPRRPAVRL